LNHDAARARSSRGRDRPCRDPQPVRDRFVGSDVAIVVENGIEPQVGLVRLRDALFGQLGGAVAKGRLRHRHRRRSGRRGGHASRAPGWSNRREAVPACRDNRSNSESAPGQRGSERKVATRATSSLPSRRRYFPPSRPRKTPALRNSPAASISRPVAQREKPWS
jgi:hypothetical protein